jgi:hypothetical protein
MSKIMGKFAKNPDSLISVDSFLPKLFEATGGFEY